MAAEVKPVSCVTVPVIPNLVPPMIYEDFIHYKDIVGRDRTLIIYWGNRGEEFLVWDVEGKTDDDADIDRGKPILSCHEQAFLPLLALSKKFLAENPSIEQGIEWHATE